MTIRLRNIALRLLALMFAYLVFTSVTQLAFLGIVRDDHAQIAERAEQGMVELISAANRISTDDAAMSILTARSAMGCDARTLDLLREIGAREPAIAYAGLADGGAFLCDSLRGNRPFVDFPRGETYALNTSGWTFIPMESELFPETATVLLRYRDVALLVNPLRLLPYQRTGTVSMSYRLPSGETRLLLGDSAPPKVGFMFYPFSADYGFSSCVYEGELCVTTYWTLDEIWQAYRLVIFGKIFIDVLLIALAVFTVDAFVRFRSSPQQRVLRALKHHRAFYFVRQPIVDLESESIRGYEILTRFRDGYGELSPDRVIPIIRQQGYTKTFTFMMLTRVLNSSSMRQLPKDCVVHFNLFPEDIGHLDEELIDEIVQQSRIRAQVCFEITEDFNFDAEGIEPAIKRLMERGYAVSIDDFGTGYSNLGKLTQFPLESLKIDRSFVKGIEGAGLRSSLIPEILAIAGRLKVKVIAEGVENPVQASALLNLGVDMAQGWHFGRPEIIDPDDAPKASQKSVGHSLTTGYNAR